MARDIFQVPVFHLAQRVVQGAWKTTVCDLKVVHIKAVEVVKTVAVTAIAIACNIFARVAVLGFFRCNFFIVPVVSHSCLHFIHFCHQRAKGWELFSQDMLTKVHTELESLLL